MRHLKEMTINKNTNGKSESNQPVCTLRKAMHAGQVDKAGIRTTSLSHVSRGCR